MPLVDVKVAAFFDGSLHRGRPAGSTGVTCLVRRVQRLMFGSLSVVLQCVPVRDAAVRMAVLRVARPAAGGRMRSS